MCVRAYVHMYVRAYMCMCVHVYVLMYMYICVCPFHQELSLLNHLSLPDSGCDWPSVL